MESTINTIMVPQGAEYQAICRGLQRNQENTVNPLAIPVGPEAVTQYLLQWKLKSMQISPTPKVLVMGLCGSLKPQHHVGDIVSYQGCFDGRAACEVPLLSCDLIVTSQVQQILSSPVAPVMAVTCDRIICKTAEKQQLAKTYDADVVDMEGFVILEFLQSLQIPVAMVRVVSDDSAHDLPDLTAAFTPEGTINPLPLALGMLRQPRAAARLIQGSLRGLKILEDLTTHLFTPKT